MIELAERLDLAQKALSGGFFAQEFFPKPLDRNGTSGLFVVCFPDIRHPTAIDLFEQTVAFLEDLADFPAQIEAAPHPSRRK
jgi:hypothetical protein